MYDGIKKVGRFVRGLVNPNYRADCYYERFNSEWKDLHKNTFEGMEVRDRIHHRRSGINDCSLVNWVLSFGRV